MSVSSVYHTAERLAEATSGRCPFAMSQEALDLTVSLTARTAGALAVAAMMRSSMRA